MQVRMQVEMLGVGVLYGEGYPPGSLAARGYRLKAELIHAEYGFLCNAMDAINSEIRDLT